MALYKCSLLLLLLLLFKLYTAHSRTKSESSKFNKFLLKIFSSLFAVFFPISSLETRKLRNLPQECTSLCQISVDLLVPWQLIIIIIIIHEFHRDASLETELQGRYVSRITLQL